MSPSSLAYWFPSSALLHHSGESPTDKRKMNAVQRLEKVLQGNLAPYLSVVLHNIVENLKSKIIGVVSERKSNGSK